MRNDQRSCKSVGWLVDKMRWALMAKCIPGVDLGESEGSLVQLAGSPALMLWMFRLEEGARFMNLTTQHLLDDLFRSENCGRQIKCGIWTAYSPDKRRNLESSVPG